MLYHRVAGRQYMKVKLNQILDGEEEVIINYREMNEEVARILQAASGIEARIMGTKEDASALLAPTDILYIESVDRGTYAYTEDDVYRITPTLTELADHYAASGFFRCSKSIILNIYRIEELRSESGNRIDARMKNGEHVVISRRYAKELRKLLKGEER